MSFVPFNVFNEFNKFNDLQSREVIDKHVPLLRSGVAEHETVRLAKELTPHPLYTRGRNSRFSKSAGSGLHLRYLPALIRKEARRLKP